MKARVKETGATFHVLGVFSNTAEGYALDEVDLYCDESDNLVVGAAPRFKDGDLENKVHTISAIIAAACSLLWVGLVTPYGWVILIWLGFITLASVLTSSYKTCLVYWLEQVAFGSTFTAAIIYSL